MAESFIIALLTRVSQAAQGTGSTPTSVRVQLTQRRPTKCIPKLPWFAAAVDNFGDGLNWELAATVFGFDALAEMTPRELHRLHGLNTTSTGRGLRLTTLDEFRGTAAPGQKVLAIGSVLNAPMRLRGDLVLGAGMDDRQWRCRVADGVDCRDASFLRPYYDPRPITNKNRSGARLQRLRLLQLGPVFAVRGRLTCDLLERMMPGRGCTSGCVLGEPALAMPFISSRWARLFAASREHRRPLSSGGMLCAIWHEHDAGLRGQAKQRCHAKMVDRLAGRDDGQSQAVASCMAISPHHEGGAFGIASLLSRSCRAVVSSSLHGIAIADALRVPAMVHGQAYATRFKFVDYFSSTGGLNLAALHTSHPPYVVESLEEALRRMESGTLQPRLSEAFLHDFARRYVAALPFELLCAKRMHQRS